MINKNILGKTGIEVSVIGFGGAPLGDLFENLDDQVCYDTLKKSLNNSCILGIRVEPPTNTIS